jgi:protein-S-isoprenylcysteine O-methyltransferase Ste14
MNIYQKMGLIIYFSFYGCFYIKLLLQRKGGIKTLQVGRGSKPKKTFIIEIILVGMLLLTAFVQFISIVMVDQLLIIIHNDFARYCGITLASLGIIILIISMATLHDSWRGGIDYNQKTQLVTTGIYKYSRNPGFIGIDLFSIGIALLFSNLLNVIFSAILILVLQLQILEEEKYLSTVFGEEYLNYRNKTSRYFGNK